MRTAAQRTDLTSSPNHGVSSQIFSCVSTDGIYAIIEGPQCRREQSVAVSMTMASVCFV